MRFRCRFAILRCSSAARQVANRIGRRRRTDNESRVVRCRSSRETSMPTQSLHARVLTHRAARQPTPPRGPPGCGGVRRTVCTRGPGAARRRFGEAKPAAYVRCTASTDASCTRWRTVCSAATSSPRRPRNRPSYAAWQAADRFDVDRDPAAWLATIAKRAAIDVYRREARRPASGAQRGRGRRPGAGEPAARARYARRRVARAACDRRAAARRGHDRPPATPRRHDAQRDLGAARHRTGNGEVEITPGPPQTRCAARPPPERAR